MGGSSRCSADLFLLDKPGLTSVKDNRERKDAAVYMEIKWTRNADTIVVQIWSEVLKK